MRKLIHCLALASFILGSSLLSGCNQSGEVTMADADIKMVESTKAEKKQINRTFQLSGTLEPLEETILSFEVGGRILKLHKNEGDQVQAGEILGKVEDSDYRLQVQKAETGVAQAGASLKKVQNGAREQEIIQTRLTVEKAQIQYDKAQDDLKKMGQLYQNGAIPKDTYDNTAIRAEMAMRDLENAKTALSLAQEGARKEDKAQTESFYQQQVVQKKQAELMLQKTALHSPLNGTVIGKLSEEGQLIGGGTPVYRIGNVSTLKVILPVPDREVAYWTPGDSVEVELYGTKRKGRIEKVYPTTNVGSGTVGVEIRLDNSDLKWIAGQVVNVTYQIQNGSGLFVPVEAVIRTGEEKPYIFLVKDGKAVKQQVEIGQWLENQLEITSGLDVGQTIVSKGADRLFDGDAIETVNGGEK